jgi:DNA-binding beta-propeller fold protein YncE
MSQSREGLRVWVVGRRFRPLLILTVAIGALGVWVSAARAAEGTAYVGNFLDGTVTPIALATATPGAPIPVDVSGSLIPSPDAIAISPDGQTAYVVDGARSAVTPIDTATNTADAPFSVGATPVSIAITPDGRTGYVGSEDLTVTPIDLATNTPGTPIPMDGYPAAIAISHDGRTAYVAETNTNQVVPIDTATDTPGSPIPVGSGPTAIAITPNGRTAYVGNSLDMTLTPIDTATNTPGAAIPLPGENCFPVSIAITPDGSTLYVTNGCSGLVTPVNLASNATDASIRLIDADDIAISRDGSAAYVTSSIRNAVIPITLPTNLIGTPIPVGNQPIAIATTPALRRPTTTSIACTPAGVAPGQSTTCTVTVTDSGPGTATTPQGRVTVATDSPGTITGSPCLLSGAAAVATCQVTYASAAAARGPVTMTATFAGDYAHAPSSGDTAVTVTAHRARTRTRIVCRPFVIALGQSTTCTATVAARHRGAGAPPTGAVTFAAERRAGLSDLGCTLSAAGDRATCQVTATPQALGPIRIRARYGGDAADAPSHGRTALLVWCGRRRDVRASRCG